MRCDEKRLNEIQARVEVVQPGPWRVEMFPGCKHEPPSVAGIYGQPTEAERRDALPQERADLEMCVLGGLVGEPRIPEAKFIAGARTDVPDLLADLRDARQLLGQVIGVLLEREPRLVREIRATLSSQGFAVVARTGNGPAYWTGKEWWFSSAHPGQDAASAGVQRHPSMPAAWRAAEEDQLQVKGGWPVEVDPYPEG